MIFEYIILKFDTERKPGCSECRWRTSDGVDQGGEGDLPEILNRLGQEGWEAYSCLGVQNICCVAFRRHAAVAIEVKTVKTDPPRRGRPPKARP